MKKRCLIALLLAGLLLTGCQQDAPKETQQPTDAAAPQDMDTLLGIRTDALAPTAPAEPITGFPIAWEEGRTFYCTAENWDMDIYLSSTWFPSVSFAILSLEHYDAEDIHISVPIAMDYEVSVAETDYHQTEYISESATGIGMPYYLYQIYRGVDWKQMQRLHAAAEEAQDWISQQEAELLTDLVQLQKFQESEEYIAARAAITTAGEARDHLMADFASVTPEELPHFYYYSVQVIFDPTATQDEAFEAITPTLGGTEHTLDVGSVRLRTQSVYRGDYPGISPMVLATFGVSTFPWSDGIEVLQPLFWFDAQEDLTLTGASYLDCAIELLGAHVTVTGQDGGKSMDFYWDMSMPVSVSAGSTVIINGYYRNPQISQMNFGTRLYADLHYTTADGEHVLQTQFDITRRWDPWLLYAVVFEGLDCGSYFADYYYSAAEVEAWREDIPW